MTSTKISYEENCVKMLINKDFLTVKKADVYFNPKMSLNREIVYSVLKNHVLNSEGVVQCLDGFSATGITSLQWKMNFKNKVNVNCCDIKDASIEFIKENCELNNIQYEMGVLGSMNESRDNRKDLIDGITIHKADANIYMSVKGSDFIHLDPFGTTAVFIESAFRNLRNNGILVLTSTDLATLLTRNPETVKRNYGVKIVKTDYNKELAVRVVLYAAARAASRSNKGFNVLLSVVDPKFILVALRVTRGPNNCDKTINQLTELLHCRICQDCGWYPPNKSTPIIDVYSSLLSCTCHKTNPGKTGQNLGPFWCGNLFDIDFVSQLSRDDDFDKRSDEYQKLMKIIKDEANIITESSDTIRMQIDEPPCKKRIKNDEFPSFYTFIKGVGSYLPKLETVIQSVRSQGYLAGRTHFDRNAIRTNIPSDKLKEIVEEIILNVAK